ncbi:diguanylate cyclase domain-containing protein [Halalkalibacter wakoensis]|nr:diguanylate cyclase [Halalkalibacter wakoensis]
MSIKKKLPIIFTLLVLCILIAHSSLHYMRSKEKLIEFNEREIELITQEISYQVENAKKGALYVEDLMGKELRTASIVIRDSLPANYEEVTNEQLVDLAQELMISHITLLAETEDDIIGVKSSDPEQIGLSTNQWLFWYDAFKQLFALEPVTVEEGLALPEYWTGPIEISSSNPEHTDKWGYYYDGSTNYIINPYHRDHVALEYEEKFGPGPIMDRFKDKLDGILELTVFNPEKFGKEVDELYLEGNNFIRIVDQPIWYGTYQYENKSVDVGFVQAAMETRESQNYIEEVNGKFVSKTFVPVHTETEDPFVIGVTYDHGLFQQILKKELWQHILLSLPFLLVVLLTSFIFSRSITKPIDHIVEKVNEIAQGNFGKNIDLKRKDELGHLAQNVNALSSSLKSYVCDLKKSQEVIEFQANHDPLTGLFNRRFFQEELAQRIEMAKEKGGTVAVLFIDIDRFKDVNDTLGHAHGDQLIQLISARIKDTLTVGNSILTRQGGDEFVVLLSELEKEEVLEVADAIVKAINELIW